jgi:sRNA-binding regulator protein Hfq
MSKGDAGDVYSREMLEKFYRMRRAPEKPMAPERPSRAPERPKAQEQKPPEKPKEEKPKEAEEAFPGLDQWKGKKVRIHLRNGSVFEGVPYEIYRYEIFLDLGGKKVDIFKHAIDYAELIEG